MTTTSVNTRYEMALVDGEKVLKILGYSEKKTKSRLFSVVTEYDLTSFFTEKELDGDFSYCKVNGIRFSNSKKRVCFTGKTEKAA
jgi:hypothetical protein